MKLVKANVDQIVEEDITRRVYLDHTENPNVGVELVEVEGGFQQTLQSSSSDSIYFISEGSGVFIIENNEINVDTEYMVFIEKTLPYSFKGKLKMVKITIPAAN